jgi:dihydrodiol dehydrogenase / D-xylose 1-dehydrogenase (NADP)
MSDPTLRTVRWAILGTGSIANDMVQILKQLPKTEVIAVGSRSAEGAKKFGDRWGIPHQYGSYEEAASDTDVDVCYIATPSMRHPQDCLLAIRCGKAVLCEKCMAPDDIVAKEVLDAARASNVLFVHGVWSRFFPAMKKIRDIIDSGEIGMVRSARASFCQNDGAGSCSALLETGIYCAQFLQWALDGTDTTYDTTGPVVRGACQVLHEESGLDEHVSALIEFPGEKIGSFECSLAHCSSRSATIYGSEGVIDVPFPFWYVQILLNIFARHNSVTIILTCAT